MVFSRADIRKAQERNALNIAKQQLGDHIASLDEVEIVKKIKKNDQSLGEKIRIIARGKK